MRQVLIVAPDSDLQRSLQFALEAEGLRVVVAGRIDDSRVTSTGFDCTILDHHAANADRDAAIAFCDLLRPVVLLANSPGHPLSPFAYRVVLKPLLGPALAAAVDAAIASRSNPT